MSAQPASFVCDLDDDALFRVSGEDAAGFLHNQLAGDVRALSGEARDLAYCSPKGRVLALGTFFEREGQVHVALPEDAAEAALQRLRMMVLRSRVLIERVDDRLSRLGVAGEEAQERLSRIVGPGLPAPGATLEREGVTVIGVRGPCARTELVGETERVNALRDELARSTPRAASASWRLADIAAGRARLHAASIDLYLPQFLNLELLGGVSFQKGCFPGQEVVARTRYLGRVVRRTRRARVEGAGLADPGTPLRALCGGRDRDAGRVLYAARSGDALEMLAVVPVALIEEGAELRLETSAGPRLELLDLPYALPSDAGG